MIRVVNRMLRARVMLMEIWATVAARRIWTGASFKAMYGRGWATRPSSRKDVAGNKGRKGF